MRIVSGDVYGSTLLVRYYGFGIIAVSVVVLLAFSAWEYVLSVVLCATSIPITLYCSYHVSDQHAREKTWIRSKLALFTGVACGILLSDAGIKVRSISPVEGVLFGTCAAVLVYLIATIVDAIANALMKPIRVFIALGHCSRCGYDLTGLTGQRCPECGEPMRTKGDSHLY